MRIKMLCIISIVFFMAGVSYARDFPINIGENEGFNRTVSAARGPFIITADMANSRGDAAGFIYCTFSEPVNYIVTDTRTDEKRVSDGAVKGLALRGPRGKALSKQEYKLELTGLERTSRITMTVQWTTMKELRKEKRK